MEQEKYTDLIIEMKEAIEWYMNNCRTINDGRSYDETFYNLGMNLISQAEEILRQNYGNVHVYNKVGQRKIQQSR